MDLLLLKVKVYIDLYKEIEILINVKIREDKRVK